MVFLWLIKVTLIFFNTQFPNYTISIFWLEITRDNLTTPYSPYHSQVEVILKEYYLLLPFGEICLPPSKSCSGEQRLTCRGDITSQIILVYAMHTLTVTICAYVYIYICMFSYMHHTLSRNQNNCECSSSIGHCKDQPLPRRFLQSDWPSKQSSSNQK